MPLPCLLPISCTCAPLSLHSTYIYDTFLSFRINTSSFQSRQLLFALQTNTHLQPTLLPTLQCSVSFSALHTCTYKHTCVSTKNICITLGTDGMLASHQLKKLSVVDEVAVSPQRLNALTFIQFIFVCSTKDMLVCRVCVCDCSRFQQHLCTSS